jgi:preprotein translocase subunit SecY
MARSPSQLAETLGGLGRLTELRQRLLFVFVALIIYRIGTFIPVPGVNPQALLQFMNSQQGTISPTAAAEERRILRAPEDYPVHA